jgi:hypothetical protein
LTRPRRKVGIATKDLAGLIKRVSPAFFSDKKSVLKKYLRSMRKLGENRIKTGGRKNAP